MTKTPTNWERAVEEILNNLAFKHAESGYVQPTTNDVGVIPSEIDEARKAIAKATGKFVTHDVPVPKCAKYKCDGKCEQTKAEFTNVRAAEQRKELGLL